MCDTHTHTHTELILFERGVCVIKHAFIFLKKGL